MFSPRTSLRKVAIWIVAVLTAVAAAGLFFASILSFFTLRAITISAIPPGYAERFTPDLYARIILGMRLLGGILGFLAVGLALFAERLSSLLARMSLDVAELIREIRATAGLNGAGAVHIATFVAIFLWAIGLRLVFLSEPIRKDEAYTFLFYASRPLFIGLAYYTANNHILNTLLMHLTTSVFGDSLWALRAPTFIVGILIVPAIYVMMRLYQGKNAALLSMALVSASSPLIEYSFNARGYSLVALLIVISATLAGFGVLRELPGAWLALPISASLALYAVPVALYGVCGVFFYILLTAPAQWRRTFRTGLATVVLTALLYAPVAATVGLSAITNNQWVAPLPRALWLSMFAGELGRLWTYWNTDLPVVLGFLVAVGVIATPMRREGCRSLLLVFLCIAIVACFAAAFQSVVPPRRTLLFLLPIWLSVAAAGWVALAPKLKHSYWVAPLLSILVTAWMGITVLRHASLRHSGSEAVGCRSAESIVLGVKDHLDHGAQFISTELFDSSLDFQMRRHYIPYRPSPTGSVLIVVPTGQSPERRLEIDGIPANQVLSIKQIGKYEDADVYLGQRGAGLHFTPQGSTEMGVFSSLVAFEPAR